MQRFVALSSSHLSLALPSVTAWKSARDGRASVSVQTEGARYREKYNLNTAFPLIRGEGVLMSCCQQGCGGGGQPSRSTSLPGFEDRRSRHGIRSQSISRGALGQRQGGSDSVDSYHERHPHHRSQQRNHPQVVDSIRDYASDSWWTDNDDSEEDGSLSPELWTSQIILQLSLFWNLLGYSPSKVDEWLVSHEAKRRLNNLTKRSRFSSSISSSPPALSSPLGDLFEGDSPLASLQKKLFSFSFFQFFSAAIPQFRPRRRLSIAIDSLQNVVYPHWFAQMARTYGTSFMVLMALGYVLQGFRCFPWFAVGYMLKDGLQVDPGYMQFLLSSAALPMVLKPIYGIISDTVYIRGAHRVPYLAIAGVLQLISWSALALSPTATSSAVLFTAALTFGNLGAAIADVMNDALVAEVSKKQKGSGSGELQSFAWLVMASGGLLGNLLGGFALKQLELTSMYFIFLILLGLHLVVTFFVNERSFDLVPQNQLSVSGSRKDIFLDEEIIPLGGALKRKNQTHQVSKAASVSGVGKRSAGSLPTLYSQLKDQVALLGKLLKKKEISHTLLWFCASYAMVPVLGSSIFFYQTQVLQIDPMFIGFSRMVGQVGLMVGSQLYGGVLKGLPLRKLLGLVQLLLSFCMLSDLFLVKRLNVQLGIPDEYYVLGLSALVDCVSQFKVLPVIVRLGHLCPPGSEGSLMAFFSSCHCLAGLCSGYFGVALAQYLRISSHSFEGLPVGIVIQAMFALLPVLFISLVPHEDTSKPEKLVQKVQ